LNARMDAPPKGWGALYFGLEPHEEGLREASSFACRRFPAGGDFATLKTTEEVVSLCRLFRPCTRAKTNALFGAPQPQDWGASFGSFTNAMLRCDANPPPHPWTVPTMLPTT